MPDLNALWDFDDPAASGARFRAAIDAAEADGDAATADEARTQLARTLGLQARFEDGDQILDLRRRRPPGRGSRPGPVAPRARPPAPVERRHDVRGGARSRRPGRWLGGWARTGWPSMPRTCSRSWTRRRACTTWNERALELANTSPDPDARRWRGSLWNNIGWERFEAKDLDGALAAFETALEARREQGKAKETRIAEWSRRAGAPGAGPAGRGPRDPAAARRGGRVRGRRRGRLRVRGDRGVPPRARPCRARRARTFGGPRSSSARTRGSRSTSRERIARLRELAGERCGLPAGSRLRSVNRGWRRAHRESVDPAPSPARQPSVRR